MTELPPWFDPAADQMLSPQSLRGLVHPIRLQLLDLLQADGPATASSLARRTGQSSGLTSYHLRKLAEHGFVVEDASRGTGRDRWWRAVHRSTSFSFRLPDSPGGGETPGRGGPPGRDGQAGRDERAGRDDQVEQAEQFMRLVAQTAHQRALAYVGTLAGQDPRELASAPWTISDWPLQLTPAEARELRAAIAELVIRFRRDPATAPRPGTVRAHVSVQLTPEEP